MPDGEYPSAGAATAEDLETSERLVDFIRHCPSMFHTAATVTARLDQAGFTHLPEGDAWGVKPGGSYYTTRNTSSVIAFRVGENALDCNGYHFQMTAAHADSPTYKVKSVPVLEGPEECLRLDVEGYGGMIGYTWLDKPLSLAGRVLVRTADGIESRLFAPDRDLLLIPSVAIHLDRTVNDGKAFNEAVDLCPLFSAGRLRKEDFDRMVAEGVGVDPEDILARDLFLVNREQPCVWGLADEFVSSPKLDDLQCAFASLEAFVAEKNTQCVTVYACFDNEEVGSNTKQGAMSTLLHDTLVRVNATLGMGEEGYLRALSRSFLVSCDNAHALHPNHPELYDAVNRCHLNGGPVIKEAANQMYTTDAFSRAVFVALCERAGVPYQTFANRSDMAGGSTLGNLSNTQVSVHAVDIGLPQLAMHSSYETTGIRDTAWTIRALREFFSADLRITGAERVEIAS
ncbi:M18 family aminopeptidase [Olsenella sp. Marseille-P4559]|uniref:M18 family aminopeptidase n=1 Tax=Olsenella sp. Marseille-P4559 TaxID=2364795 RepID=UPI0010314289|nr:M18 family aminopeptidase [Olsenella sp. Marseille-P4559]